MGRVRDKVRVRVKGRAEVRAKTRVRVGVRVRECLGELTGGNVLWGLRCIQG